MDLHTFRERFEPHLRRFLLKKAESLHTYSADAFMRTMLAEPNRLFAAGGKRIRPLLCIAGYALAGGRDQTFAFRAAVSLELFHLFALIHDDVMDRGEERHGVLTAHRSIERQLRDQHRRGELAHIGVSQAIIVGDLLFAWAFEALLLSGGSSDAVKRAQEVFSAMADEVMVGQMLDVDLMTRSSSTREEITQKMLLKTAGYTFIRPLEMGVALAGSYNESLLSFARAFGQALGIAFQIQDDIMDAFGTLEEIGKTPLSDVRDHQHSLLTQWVLDHGSTEDRSVLSQVWGKSAITVEDGELLRRVFIRSGALQAALEACEAYRETAETVLGTVPMADSLQALFDSIVQKAVPNDLLARIRARSSDV